MEADHNETADARGRNSAAVCFVEEDGVRLSLRFGGSDHRRRVRRERTHLGSGILPIVDFETRTSPRSMVRWHISVLPLYSEWQHVYAQRKLLLIDTPQLCCAGARLRNNRRHLSWPDDLRNMHSGSLPGSGLPSGHRLWHRERLSLLSRGLEHRILSVGQTTCSARPAGRGERSDGTLVGRCRRSVPRGHARHRQALLALAL